MGNAARLSADQRKQAIVDAVRDVFAEKGFDGTTTRELAKAAGVSEALLYKHFPSKESLYAAMLDGCAKGPTFAEASRILELDASTTTFPRTNWSPRRPGSACWASESNSTRCSATTIRRRCVCWPVD